MIAGNSSAVVVKDDTEAETTLGNMNDTTRSIGGVMKTREIAKKGLYIGTGAGPILFALVGLLPGS